MIQATESPISRFGGADVRTAAAPKVSGSSQPPPFAAILQEASIPVVQPDQGGVSPQQMFDAGAPDPRTARKTALQGQYRDALAKGEQRRSETRDETRIARVQTPNRSDHSSESQWSVAEPQLNIQERFVHDPGRFPEQQKNAKELPTAQSRVPEQPQQLMTESSRVPSSGTQATHKAAPIGEPEPASALTPAGNRIAGTSAAHEVAHQLGSKGSVNAERDAGTVSTTALSKVSDAGTSRPRETAESLRPGAAPRTNAKPNSSSPAPATNFERLVRSIRAQSGRQSSARIMLDPPELGKVHVRVKVMGDKVEIGVETENEGAREIIVQRAAKLKSALEEHGLVVDRLDVSTNQAGLFERPSIFGQEAEHSRRDAHGQASRRESQGRERANRSQPGWSIIQTAGRLQDNTDSLDVQV